MRPELKSYIDFYSGTTGDRCLLFIYVAARGSINPQQNDSMSKSGVVSPEWLQKIFVAASI